MHQVTILIWKVLHSEKKLEKCKKQTKLGWKNAKNTQNWVGKMQIMLYSIFGDRYVRKKNNCKNR